MVTHAPPRGLGDLSDPAHRGFEALLPLLERYRPALLLHGHVHLRYSPLVPREQSYLDTRIINVSDRFELELPDRAFPPRDKGRLIWMSRHRESDHDWPSFRLTDP